MHGDDDDDRAFFSLDSSAVSSSIKGDEIVVTIHIHSFSFNKQQHSPSNLYIKYGD